MERKFKHKKNGSTMVYKDGCMKVDNLVIEGHPNMEYWEELNPIGYKILSYTKNGNLYDEELEGSDRVVHIGSVFEKDRIIKVKRLSDNEVFKVGDEIEGRTHPSREIDEIILTCDKIYFEQWGGRTQLEDAKKVKDKLFTTEDEVDIYFKDKYWTVYTMDNARGVYNTWKVQGYFYADGIKSDYIHEDVKYFSSPEAAKEYILMNKPQLSLNDVFKVYPEFKKKEPGVRTHHAQQLIDLVLRDEK